MDDEAAWTAVVVKKSRALLDGSNLYRRVRVRYEDGREESIRIDRPLWKQLDVGDRLLKEPGQEPRRP